MVSMEAYILVTVSRVVGDTQKEHLEERPLKMTQRNAPFLTNSHWKQCDKPKKTAVLVYSSSLSGPQNRKSQLQR